MKHYDTLGTFTRGDTHALFEATITDPSMNAVVDLTGMTIKLYPIGVRSGTTITAITGAIQGAPTGGVVRFDCRTIAAGTDPLYRCQIELTDSVPEVQRSEDFFLAVKDKVGT